MMERLCACPVRNNMFVVRMGQRWGSWGQCTTFPTSHVEDLLEHLKHAPLSGGEMNDFITVVMKDGNCKVHETLGVRKSLVFAAIRAAHHLGSATYREMSLPDVLARTNALHAGEADVSTLPKGLETVSETTPQDDEPPEKVTAPPTGTLQVLGVAHWDAQRPPGVLFEDALAKVKLTSDEPGMRLEVW